MTAQDLKNSILQLAVQGKLVPQDPSDEPASELLERIKRYRETAIKNGTLSIDKKHTADPILEDDIPYDLPDPWKWVRFADIVTFNSGKTPARQETTNWSNGVCPWVSIADMVADGITVDTKEMVSEKAISESFSGKISPIGTMIMSFKLTIGKMSILGIDAVHNEAIISIFPTVESKDEDVIKAYLFKILPLIAITGDSKNAVKGKTLNATSISNLMIPLPPIAEQKRIVAKIEELLPLIERYGEAEERLKELNTEFPDKLRKSILQQAVQGKLTERDPADEPASELLKRIRTEKATLIAEEKIKKEKPLPLITDEEKPFDIPDTWEWVRLGELGETQTGTTPSTKNPAFFGNDIPFIKPADIYADHINYENEGLSFAGSEQGRIISKNSIMMVCIGGSIGKTYYNDRSVCCNQQINTITPIFCSVKYVWLAMSSNYFRCELQKEATGTATPIINKSLWSNIVIPLPPLAEQERIVARVEELLAVCDGLKRKE